MNNIEQLELFANIEKPEKIKGKKPDGNTLDLRRYKRAIWLFIYSVIILIIGFAIGVEHTKNTFNLASSEQSFGAKLIVQEKRTATNIGAVSASKGNFIIQLAAFKSPLAAKSELSYIKKRGYSAYLLASKGTTRLYGGPFKTREEADRNLKSLKTRYPGCFIKK